MHSLDTCCVAATKWSAGVEEKPDHLQIATLRCRDQCMLTLTIALPETGPRTNQQRDGGQMTSSNCMVEWGAALCVHSINISLGLY